VNPEEHGLEWGQDKRNPEENGLEGGHDRGNPDEYGLEGGQDKVTQKNGECMGLTRGTQMNKRVGLGIRTGGTPEHRENGG
jgi:hypothetical protein